MQSTREIVWEIPEGLYQELERAQIENSYPDMITLISQAVQRYLAELKHENWLSEFRNLQQQVRASGGFHLGETKEQVIANLREQRKQMFEAEIENLY